MVITGIVVALVLVGLVGFGVVAFNRLRTKDVEAEEAIGGIDVQLTRRAELIPNLVETVKGYAAHEKGVLEEVTRARTHVQDAAAGDDVPAKARADAELTEALVRVNAVAEQYPDLKASTNFLDLQAQLQDTENKIATSRQVYNDTVLTFNNAIQVFPAVLIAGPFGFTKREFYEIDDGTEREVPTVSFEPDSPAAPAAPPAGDAPAPPA